MNDVMEGDLMPRETLLILAHPVSLLFVRGQRENRFLARRPAIQIPGQ